MKSRRITLNELKQVGTEMLQYVDTTCKNNGIKYYLMFGTLIGAIRHQGYIPWDDDIDIAMFRKDYEKFIEIVEKEGKYRYIGVENDPNYYFSYGRLTDKRTILKQRPKRKIKGFGIFIDLFPIDNAPYPSEVEKWREDFKEKKMKVWATIPTPYDDFTWKNFAHYCIRAIREQKKRIKLGVHNFPKYREDLLGFIQKYNNEERDVVMVAETNGPCIFPKHVFDDTLDTKFETVNAMIPIGYDEILRSIFGDYMQLPPEDQRVSGHEFVAYWCDDK